MKNTSLLLLIGAMICTGCSFVYDLYPTKIPPESLTYVSKDPNSVGWPCISKIREIKEEVTSKHLLTQKELSYLVSKDDALYSRAIDQVTFNLVSAETERQKLIGTMENPGYLLGILLPIVGGFAGRAITTLTHYSEQELQAEVAKAKNGSNPATNATAA